MTTKKVGKARKAGQKRVGFLAGHLKVPADFDSMGAEGIEKCFGLLQSFEAAKSLEGIEEAIKAGWAGEPHSD